VLVNIQGRRGTHFLERPLSCQSDEKSANEYTARFSTMTEQISNYAAITSKVYAGLCQISGEYEVGMMTAGLHDIGKSSPLP
jgi:hypothetical protein